VCWQALSSVHAIYDFFPIQDGEPAAPTFDWMPAGMKPMADGEYDVVVMGTGFTEVRCRSDSLLYWRRVVGCV